MLMRTPSDITNVEKLKDAIFGQLWLIIGSNPSASLAKTANSLLHFA